VQSHVTNVVAIIADAKEKDLANEKQAKMARLIFATFRMLVILQCYQYPFSNFIIPLFLEKSSRY